MGNTLLEQRGVKRRYQEIDEEDDSKTETKKFLDLLM